MNLDEIPVETLIARGRYSSVRAVHEDEKKRLAELCGALQSIPFQILKIMQPAGEDAPNLGEVIKLVAGAHQAIEQIEECCMEVFSLHEQKYRLKPEAWGKK